MTMTSRRTFTFASLALAATATARAADLQNQAQAPSPRVPDARWTVERKSDEIVASVTFVNVTGRPVSVLTKQGSRPGGSMQAALEVDGEAVALAEIRDIDRREMMSRMGPVPQFVEIAPGADVALGPWRFALPKGSRDEAVSLVAQLFVDNQTIELRSGPIEKSGKSV